VRVSAGLARDGLRQADAIGAEAVQVFTGNPRGWAASAGDPAQDAAFRSGCEQRGIVAFVHSPYLVNLASPDRATARRSAEAVTHALQRGRAVGAAGVVVHTGSTVLDGDPARALRQVRRLLLPVLDALPDAGPDLLLEPTAGQGRSLCGRMEELEPYLAALDGHPRLGVCLDTCHAFAAGHDLAAPRGMRRTLDALVRAAGPGRLRLVHANDSVDGVGSHLDRHAPIGAGQIGADAFAEMFAHRALDGVPVVVETPGTPEQHAVELALLRTLRDR